MPNGDQGPKRRSAAEQYIAGLRGVGPGLLDTLRALFDAPIAFDTSSADPNISGQFTPGDTARVVVNPRSKTVLGTSSFPEERAHGPALTLAHEVIGHGRLGYGGDPYSERAAENAARSFLRLSGRSPNLPYNTAGEMRSMGTVRRLLADLDPSLLRRILSKLGGNNE